MGYGSKLIGEQIDFVVNLGENVEVECWIKGTFGKIEGPKRREVLQLKITTPHNVLL